jgi:hypothetical protein
VNSCCSNRFFRVNSCCSNRGALSSMAQGLKQSQSQKLD